MDLSQRVLAGAATSAHAYAEIRAGERRRQDAERFPFLAHDLRNPLETGCVFTIILPAVQPDDQRA